MRWDFVAGQARNGVRHISKQEADGLEGNHRKLCKGVIPPFPAKNQQETRTQESAKAVVDIPVIPFPHGKEPMETNKKLAFQICLRPSNQTKCHSLILWPILEGPSNKVVQERKPQVWANGFSRKRGCWHMHSMTRASCSWDEQRLPLKNGWSLLGH